jgi:hypothetical protein
MRISQAAEHSTAFRPINACVGRKACTAPAESLKEGCKSGAIPFAGWQVRRALADNGYPAANPLTC